MTETKSILRPASSFPFGTFGTYRYILSLFVIITHTAPEKWHYAGEYAVFAFYTLSGYVVTYILARTYLPVRHGLWKYAVNRGLRIYILYWAACAFSFVLVRRYPAESLDINPAYILPSAAIGWLVNLSAFGMANPFSGAIFPPQLLPVGWTLGIEMFYWAVIPIVLQSILRKRVFLGVAVFYALTVAVRSLHQAGSDNLSIRYSSVLAAALPFCAGMFLFLIKNNTSRAHHALGIISIPAFFAVMCFAPFLFADPDFGGFYSALAINIAVVAYLSRISQETLPAWLSRTDGFLGNLAYPIYLVHMPVAILAHVIWPDQATRGWEFAILCTVTTMPLALVFHLMETPINRLKQKIK